MGEDVTRSPLVGGMLLLFLCDVWRVFGQPLCFQARVLARSASFSALYSVMDLAPSMARSSTRDFLADRSKGGLGLSDSIRLVIFLAEGDAGGAGFSMTRRFPSD